MTDQISLPQLQQLARESGLDVVGVCDFKQIKAAHSRLQLWQEAGHAGEMRYMKRSPELLTASEHLLPGARSVLSCTLRYSQEPHPDLPNGQGRVARYAWGRDYHLVIPELLRQLVERVEQLIGRKISARVFSDALPFLERAGAHSAGLGFIGKNTMLIKKGLGSYFFIAEILWDLEVEQLTPAPAQSNSCGSCTRCLDNCPTGAFVEPFVLHAPRCISYLTIEKRGLHTIDERRALGEWIFGCDICQDVCPFNYTTLKHPESAGHEQLAREHGTGPLLDLASVLSIHSNREFETRFAGTPLLRPGRTGLQRNGLAVAANTRAHSASQAILDIATNSPSAVLRATALWALAELNRDESTDGFKALCNKLLRDPDHIVRLEAEQLVKSD